VERNKIHRKSLNDVKRSIQKTLNIPNGKIEIMARDAIMIIVQLVGGYFGIKMMELYKLHHSNVPKISNKVN